MSDQVSNQVSNQVFNQLFSESSDEVLKRIKFASSAEDLVQCICFSKENQLIVDYRYFKHIATTMSYHMITTRIISMIDEILSKYPKFIAHMCIKTLTVGDVEKHIAYIKALSNTLKERYQDKMTTCSVYKAPFIFAQIYGLVSCFIDKDTQAKISLIKK